MEVGENSKKAMETLTCQLMFPQHFLLSQTSTRVSIKQLDYELKSKFII